MKKGVITSVASWEGRREIESEIEYPMIKKFHNKSETSVKNPPKKHHRSHKLEETTNHWILDLLLFQDSFDL